MFLPPHLWQAELALVNRLAVLGNILLFVPFFDFSLSTATEEVLSLFSFQ